MNGIRLRHRFLLLFATCLITFLMVPASATTMKKLTPEELVAEADVVVKGKIVDVASRWEEDQTVIYTYVRASVDEYVKGAGPGEVTIRQLGGIVDDIGLYIEGAPEFEQGERALLYLRQSMRQYDNTYFEVVGLSQGKIALEISQEVAFGAKNDYALLVLLMPSLLLPAISLRKMKHRNVYSGSFSLLVVSLLLLGSLTTEAFAFRIFGPNGVGDYVTDLTPSSQPPFVHWDLREFPNCKVPWSITDNTPDVDGDGSRGAQDPTEQITVFNAVFDAFQEWENGAPAVIGFVAGDRFGAVSGRRAIRLDGYNLIDWGTSGGLDDIQVVPVGGAAAPGGIVVSPGPNGFLETQPQGDDVIVGNNIVEPLLDGNGVADTTANNQGNVVGAVAITGLFFNVKDGTILEADILFNDALHWTIGTENPPADYDVQVTATHEIGHFIGIAHTPVVGPPVPTMNGAIWPADLSKRTLEADDKDAINFLYTPDLGDAPDPPYPSLVHNGPGRTLSGVPLLSPDKGAEHLYGLGTNQFEWLGESMDNSPQECESLQVNKDDFDDGVVVIWLDPDISQRGSLKFQVSTSGLQNRYDPDDATTWIYVNGWFDWNRDGDWDDDKEHALEWHGGPGITGSDGELWPDDQPNRVIFSIIEVPQWFETPDLADAGMWARFRLDRGENAGLPPPANFPPGVGQPDKVDPSLDGPRGAAQFGEVEDYYIGVDAIAVWDRHEPPPRGIYYSIWDDTTKEWWTPAGPKTAPISTPSAESSDFEPAIAFNRKGEATVVWEHQRTEGVPPDMTFHSDIYYSRWGWFSATTPDPKWTVPGIVHLSEGDMLYHVNPAVAFNSSGSAMVIWVYAIEQVWPPSYQLWYRLWEGANWVGEPETIPATISSSVESQIAADAHNNYIAVWDGVYYSWWHHSTASWSSQQQIPLSQESLTSNIKGISTDRLGNAKVVWTSPNGIDFSIWNGLTHDFSPAQTAAAGDYRSPSIAFDQDNNATAPYARGPIDDPSPDIWYSRQVAESWNPPLFLADSGDPDEYPRIAFIRPAAESTAITVWLVKYPRDPESVYFSRWDGTSWNGANELAPSGQARSLAIASNTGSPTMPVQRLPLLTLARDLAVTNVTASKTVVGQGFSLSIDVTVENQGGLAETFNVTAYYAGTPTSEQWETFWSMGDVNRDGYIDDTDVDLLEAAYGSTPGDPNWNPDADLNQDLIVDLYDALILSSNYGLDVWTYFGLVPQTTIGTQTVENLASGAITTITSTWDTTEVPYGDYTISAYATPVSGETYTADNTYTDGTVFVRVPGDVNNDGTVDIFDIGNISAHWYPGPPIGLLGYDSNADINNDGAVDIFDIGIVSSNWG